MPATNARPGTDLMVPATRTLAVRIHCSLRVSGRLPTSTLALCELITLAIGPPPKGGGACGPSPPPFVCVVPPTCAAPASARHTP